MRLTTEYREERVGVLTGVKHYFLICTVEFRAEERAIIQERGLYDKVINVPSDRPAPTRVYDWKSRLMRIAGMVIAPFGLLTSCAVIIERSKGVDDPLFWPILLLVGGVALLVIGKWRDRQAGKRYESDIQSIKIRTLLKNPTFKVHAYEMGQAREYEEEVRAELKGAAEGIRSHSVVPETTTDEF